MNDDEILRLLKEHSPAFVSGEAIGRHLKLTRTSVWKRVKNLRALGYVIEALPRAGYRLTLSPDLLLPSEIHPLLRTKWMGKKIHYFNPSIRRIQLPINWPSKGPKKGKSSSRNHRNRGEEGWEGNGSLLPF